MKSNSRFFNRVKVFLGLVLLSSCGTEIRTTGDGPSNQNNGNACRAGIPSELRFLESSSPLRVQDELSRSISVATFDDCGNSVETVEPATLVSSHPAVRVAQIGPSSSEIRFEQGAADGVVLSATYGALTASLPVDVRHSVATVSQLNRWYRVQSMSTLAHGALIGTSTSLLPDLGASASSFAGNASVGREPRLDLNTFSKPTLQFCGVSAGCAGVTSNSHLRVGSNFSEYAGSDVTVVTVVARANNQVNQFLTNQSNGNNNGLFLGFTSNTNLRFGLAGLGGNPQVNATVAGFSGSPSLDLIVARLNTSGASAPTGLSLRLNGVAVGQNSSVMSGMVSNTLIPYVGTQRSDQNAGRFFLGMIAIYKKALTDTEVCSIETALNREFSLGLSNLCSGSAP